MIPLPELPYAKDALAPTLSERTLTFHHDKHHAKYVKTTNELLEKKGARYDSLEEVIGQARAAGERKLFNNAAQAWNHSFFWLAMSPDRQTPPAELGQALASAFGDLSAFEENFVGEGEAHFGSGWVWLVADPEGALKVITTHDADDLVAQSGHTPLLVCDLWEHAYYLDYQNDRKGFLEAWVDALPNWGFAARQFQAARGQGRAWTHPLEESVA